MKLSFNEENEPTKQTQTLRRSRICSLRQGRPSSDAAVSSLGWNTQSRNKRPQPSQVTNQRLPNYLRAQRRKSGLSQNEVAFLLGRMNGAQVSRYEKRRRLPSVETALACEVIFGVPIGELFAGVRDSIGKDIEKRRRELSSKLRTKTPKGSEARMTEHKLRWLNDHQTHAVANQSSLLP